VVCHLVHRYQFVQEVGELLRRLLQRLLQPVLLLEFREHLRVVAAPMLQNQAAEAVAVWHGIPRKHAPERAQPALAYL
jgi:hypothetical protein